VTQLLYKMATAAVVWRHCHVTATARRVQGRHLHSTVATAACVQLTTAASSQTFAQEDCARLTLVRYSSDGRVLTSATGLSLSVDGRQTTGLIIQPFQTVA